MKENKIYKVAQKTNEENYELNELLESAHGKIQEAQNHITYSVYPEINAELIRKLKEIEDAIFDIEIAVENQEILKPVRQKTKEETF